MVAINIGMTRKGRAHKMAFYNVQKSSMSMKLTSTTFSGNQKYTCTHTKSMYNVFAHKSLPTLAILALGLLEKKEEEDEQFCVGGNNTF